MGIRGSESHASASERVEEFRRSVEAGAFWGAILFPAAYVPFLAVGIEGVEQTAAFVALVASHVVLLTAGHTYRR